jgi:trimeric autotransporter adhesin
MGVDCANLTPCIAPLSAGRIITTVAGTGVGGYSGDGGQATSAMLKKPLYVAVDAFENIYISDAENSRVRMVTRSTGIITTVAGDGTRKYKGDGGPATSAALNFPLGVAVDASGNVYISDGVAIRMVTKSTGIITTVAGNGTFGYGGDGGPGASASVNYAAGIAVDALGNLYIGDVYNNRIRMVTRSTGIITTVAGDGSVGFAGDGKQATSASLYLPYGVAVDTSGNIYIADALNHRIRIVTRSTGIITTVAGDGSEVTSGDGGPAISAGVYYPNCIAVDAAGNIYVAATPDQRVRIITKGTGIITTVAGDGTDASGGDGGPATSASLSYPYGVAVDASGNLYISDFNNRIRMVSYSVEPDPSARAPTSVPPFPGGSAQPSS